MRLFTPLLTGICMVCLLTSLTVVGAESSDEAQTKRFEAFTQQLTKATLVGKFTVQGRGDGEGRAEEYAIESVTKMPNGDFWLFKARMKYGNRDVTLPMPLEVKWAGDTPVITLSETTIPGLGTFSARVVIHGGQYAGIWKHGEFGGQMFGEIKRTED